jgi:hypothetical protein
MAEHQALRLENRTLPEVLFVGAGRVLRADAALGCVCNWIVVDEKIARRACMKLRMFRLLTLDQASDWQTGGLD